MICPGYSASERLNLIPRIHFGFPSDRRLRFTPYRLDSVHLSPVQMCCKALQAREHIWAKHEAGEHGRS